ncbi:MAG: twin-arginine translocation signal domain-containing protein, partial [Coriobacteriia bacterium]|nr:twin-arginine translocation signal domain-containing protein [Coriobacteriia bacterium]
MTFYESLSQRGVSRRDFLKFCGSTAAVLGLSSTFVPTLAAKIAGAAESGLTPALWISGGKCTGCLESIAQAAYPNVADIVLDLLTLNSQTAISMATGKYAEEAKKKTYEQYADRPFIMLYEGTVMEGLRGNTLLAPGGTTSLEVIDNLAPKAAVILALGACAVDGGWVRAFPNPAGGTGMQKYLKKRGIDTPVVNLPGCPVSPEEITAVVVQALLLGEDGTLESGIKAVVDSLDSLNRPNYLYGAVIHDSCPRRGHFE